MKTVIISVLILGLAACGGIRSSKTFEPNVERELGAVEHMAARPKLSSDEIAKMSDQDILNKIKAQISKHIEKLDALETSKLKPKQVQNIEAKTKRLKGALKALETDETRQQQAIDKFREKGFRPPPKKRKKPKKGIPKFGTGIPVGGPALPKRN